MNTPTISEFKTQMAAKTDSELSSMFDTLQTLEDPCFAESLPADFAERRAIVHAEISSRPSMQPSKPWLNS